MVLVSETPRLVNVRTPFEKLICDEPSAWPLSEAADGAEIDLA